jgi:hypothetical protein
MIELDSFEGANPKIGFHADTSFGRVGLLSANEAVAYSLDLIDDEQPKDAPKTSMITEKKKRLLLFIYLFTSLWLFADNCQANSEANPASPSPTSIAIFGGPGSMTPLVDIARAREFKLESQFILGAALDHTLWTNHESLAWEAEGSLVKYLENASALSLSGAIVLRWLRTPWSSKAGKARSSFAFGNGLSYATEVPELESRLEKTSHVLYHLFLEITFTPNHEYAWEALFRIQHRSGAFGLFNGVVGGSDFLCLGIRYRL